LSLDLNSPEKPESSDVPVWTLGEAHVVSQSGTDAAGRKCAINVNVGARLEEEAAKPPDSDNGIAG